MRLVSACLVALLSVSACSHSSITSSATSVVVDGQSLYARETKPGIWAAGFDNVMRQGGVQGPERQMLFTRAIEQVSGCKVMPGSTSWVGSFMLASVTCG